MDPLDWIQLIQDVYDVNLCVNTSVVGWFLSLKVAVLHFKQTRRATEQFPHRFCKLTSLSPGKLGKLTSLWPIVEGLKIDQFSQ